MAQDVIIRGVTYQGVEKLSLPVSGGSALFRDTSDGDAVAGEIVSGKKAYNANGAVNGSMVNQGAVSGTISDKDTPYTIPAGYHNGSGTVEIASAQKALLLPGNIRDGVTILGVTGNYSGGGGGPTASDAILTVTVPTGSTVTATKGGVTLLPTIWVQAADNTLDYALFIIKPSLFDSVNPWTVTATLDASSASKTVTIDSNKQYDIVLAYILWLFDGGEVSPYTFSKGAGKTFTVSSTIHIAAYSGSQAWGTASPAVNLSGYSTLKMNVSAIGVDKDGRDKLYISTTQSESMAASVGATNTGEFSLDVSSYSGDYYIGLFTNNNGEFTVDKIWLEG